MRYKLVMKALFLSGHAALDFLNTAYAPNGTQVETIGDGRSLLTWLTDAGILTEDEAKQLRRRLGAMALDRAAAEARKIREWARAWVERWRVDPDGEYGSEIAAINKFLARGAFFYEVNESQALMKRSRLTDVDALVALVAEPLAELVTQEEARLVKSCAGSGCTLLFLDRTKAHKRLYCSASACGNRAKVAAFREREREQRS